ncbi:MAG TPA: MFS transporter, partial [Steroidobacteraceae bacterium]|nr:MFS transporter [Steroidobacteraceae bacterium]
MPIILRTTWPLLLGMGILMLGAGLQGTLVGVRATLEGYPTPVIGAIMSCYYLGYLIGTLCAPRMLHRIGHIRVFAALAAIAAVTILIQGEFVHPLSWAAMRLLTGWCFSGIYVVAESWLNDRACCETRGRLMAVYMAVLYIGLGSAQFLLLLSNPRSSTPFALVAALISLAVVPIALSAQHMPTFVTRRPVCFRELYRNSPLGLVAVAVSGMISAIQFAMGPVYARLTGQGVGGVALFMSISFMAAVVTQYPIGRLSDRIDRRTVIAGVCTVATIVAVTLALCHRLPPGLYFALQALFSGAVLTLYSLAVSHVNDKLEPEQMVSASSALLLLNGAAAAVGPMLVGRLMSAFGPSVYFVALAVLTG